MIIPEEFFLFENFLKEDNQLKKLSPKETDVLLTFIKITQQCLGDIFSTIRVVGFCAAEFVQVVPFMVSIRKLANFIFLLVHHGRVVKSGIKV